MRHWRTLAASPLDAPRSSSLVALLVALCLVGCDRADEKQAAEQREPAHSVSSAGTAALKPGNAPPAVPPPDAQQVGAGIKMQVLEPGVDAPKEDNYSIVAHLDAWTLDGSHAYSTSETGPATFDLATVDQSVRPAIARLGRGAIARFWLSKASWRPGGFPTGAIVTEITIKDFGPAPETQVRTAEQNAPPDGAGAPSNARTTRGGVKYLTVHPPSSEQVATPNSRLRTIIDAWALKGALVESVVAGHHWTTHLGNVDGDVSEILSRLRVGETVRAWLPEKTAMNLLPGKVEGAAVVDIRLIALE